VFIVPPPFPRLPHGSPVPRALLLHGPRLADGQVADVLIAGGTIVSVGAEPAAHPPSAEILDLRDYLLLPSLVEPHAHLGSAACSGRPGAEIAARARAAAARHVACGTTAIRVHIDVGGEAGLRSVEALSDVRADLAGIIDIQIVAVTSAPVTGLAGSGSRERLRRALAAGADLAGAALVPGDDTGRAVEVLAVVAADAGAGLDLHIDETAAPDTLPRLIAIAQAGFGYPVTASHVVSLGATIRERRRAARSLAEAGIGVVALLRPGIVPHGGGFGADAPRGMTAVRDLVEAGVPVAAGSHSPQGLGHADPLETASLALTVARLTPAEALTAVTSAGRQIMRLPDVTVWRGSPADLVAIRTEDLGSALASGTADRIVLRGGRVVARTQMAAEHARPELRIMRSAWNLGRPAR
jgi:cytosine deaminase